MFARMSIDETRAACKEKIESREFWLRRLIDLTLTALQRHSGFDQAALQNTRHDLHV